MDQDRQAELRTMFRGNLLGRLEAFVGAWSQRNADPETAMTEVRRLAHKLKGSAAMYGFKDLSAAARDVANAKDEALAECLARLLALIEESAQSPGA